MRKKGLLLLGVLFLASHSASAAVPDPHDSLILESKIVAPVSGTGGVVRMRVWITNKDSLTFVTMPLIESSVSGGAYMILSRPRNFAGVVAPLTSTLQGQKIVSTSKYNSTSPDSFLVAAGFDPLDSTTIEPPNASRKALWDIKFDTVVSSAQVGFVQFDSGKVVQSLQFTNTLPLDMPVNFVKSVFQVGVALKLNLISPLDSAVVPTQRPTFLWNTARDTAARVASYTVFLADNQFFSPTDTSPPLPDTSWQVPSNLTIQGTYYWKVRAITPGHDTAFSIETRSFRVDAPPTAPTDISPPSGSDISMYDYLVWLESTDPDPGDQVSYQVQIDDNSDFSSPEVDQNGVNASTLAQSVVRGPWGPLGNAMAIPLSHFADHDNLKDDSLYYWRLRAVDNHGGVSAYTSGQRKFYLNLADSSPHPVPGGFMPSGGIVLHTNHPLFSWFHANDPDAADPPSSLQYDVRLDTDGEILLNRRFAYRTAPGETTLVIPDSLAENGHWFWAVRTVDSKGARSAFSAIQDFYVDAVPEPPGPFSLVAPVDSAFTVTRKPTLHWNDAVDPDPFDTVRYRVAVSPLANFDSAFTAGGILANSFTLPPGGLGIRGRIYFWNVRAFDRDSLNTPSTEVFRLTLLKLGDANRDGQLTAADIVLLLGFIFVQDPQLDPPAVADLNCDGTYSATDIVLALNAVFLNQTPPCDP